RRRIRHARSMGFSAYQLRAHLLVFGCRAPLVLSLSRHTLSICSPAHSSVMTSTSKAESASLLILAGGRATRLGGARKALLEVGGRPILARILDALGPLADDRLALVHDTELPAFDRLQVVLDPRPHAGPAQALASGLRAASGEVCLVVAGDM